MLNSKISMIANQNAEKNFLYVNDGAALFQRVLTGDFVNDAVSLGISYSLDAVDIDNDGDVDLLVANNNGLNGLYLNEGTTPPQAPLQTLPPP